MSEKVSANVRFDAAVEDAELVFWSSIADSYPEVVTGDFAPELSFALQEAMKAALSEWLKSNTPESVDVAELVPAQYLPRAGNLSRK